MVLTKVRNSETTYHTKLNFSMAKEMLIKKINLLIG
jgi:hypothetical protein